MTTPRDETERDAPSAGSVANGNLVECPKCGSLCHWIAFEYGYGGLVYIPRDSLPVPTLTDAELEALSFTVAAADETARLNPDSKVWPKHAAVLRSMLERLK